MKFNMMINPYAANESFAHTRFPCAGILRNISFHILAGPSNAITDNWRVMFGELDVQSLKATSPYTDETLLMTHSREGNYVSIQQIDFEVPTAGSDQATDNWCHMGSKTIRIRSDVIYTLGLFNKLANARKYVLMQAEFIPYKNSYYKQEFVIDAIVAGSNFDLDVVIPASLKNVVLEYDIYVDNASEVSGWLQPMILRKDYEIEMGTGMLSGLGVVDGTLALTGDVRYGNTIDKITVGSAGAGLAVSQGAIPVRDIIRAGDRIAFDLTEVKGTMSGLKISLKIHGRVIPDRSRFKSVFMESDWLRIIPQEVM